MTTVTASEFFGGKPTQAAPVAPSSAPKKKGAVEKIVGAAERVTDALGLHEAVDTIGENLVNIRHPRLMEEIGAPQPSLKKSIKAGVQLGLAVPAPELGGVAASVGVKGIKAATKVVGKGVEATGEKIQQSVIRPSIKDVKDGFKIENVAKYNVGGSLPETITKTHTKLNELGQRLKAALKSGDAEIDLNEALAETARRLGADKAGTFGDNAALDRVLDQIGDEVIRTGKIKHDLFSATNVKRGAGTKGAWAYNRPEPDASAVERAYTEFYSVLKDQIEKVAPPAVREINKQLSELIPIQTAALRRLPVEQRNNVFSLTDSIGFMSALFDPKALLLVGASRAARSGKVGDTLVKTGQKLQGKR